MGKASSRRRRAQIRYLASLATDPMRFRAAITKRLESEAELIATKAGRIDTPVFGTATQMQNLLNDVAAVASHAGNDICAEIADANDTLTRACCRELAKHAGRHRHAGEMYRLTLSLHHRRGE